jgi:hypothetical protein
MRTPNFALELSVTALSERACGTLTGLRPARSTRKSDIIMRGNLKVLLVLELLVCFAPAVVLLILGLIIIPASFAMEPRLENLHGPAMLVGGLCGVIGISFVVAALMSGKEPRLASPVVLILAALGLASLLPLVVGSVDSFRWRLFGLLPILAGLHVMYLARSLLFKKKITARGQADDA